MWWLKSLFRNSGFAKGEAGIADGVAIVASLAVAAAMATAVTTSGANLVDAIQNTVSTSVNALGRPVELQGPVLAQAAADGKSVDRLILPIMAGARAVDLDGTSIGSLVVSLRTDTGFVTDVPYEALEVRGDGDLLLEQGELFQLLVSTRDITSEDQPIRLQGGNKFTLELISPGGGHTGVSRALPPVLQPLMPLY